MQAEKKLKVDFQTIFSMAGYTDFAKGRQEEKVSKQQQVFQRIEKKYRLTGTDYEALYGALQEYMQPDEFGWHTICNLYFDTPDDLLIRRSLEKPIYKEKLRLRSYGVPGEADTVYAEIKKKYKDVVYKRREGLTMAEARQWLLEGGSCPVPTQIGRELAYMMQHYSLRPRVFIGYDRIALAGRENPELRLTMDTRLRWRTQDLDLTKGDGGLPLMQADEYLMEIKIPGAMPLWMCRLLEQRQIRPHSFSKYGTCYQQYLQYGADSSDWRGKEQTAC